MYWVDRLRQVVDGRPYGRIDIDWTAIESRVGAALPADYKKFCKTFGSGEFCDFLTVYASVGGTASELADSHKSNRRIAEEHPVVLDGYLPHGLYRPGVQGGILQWGTSVQGDEFAWLVDSAVAPEAWPVAARDDAGNWQRFAMPMSEFVYRLLVEESFKGFSGFGATGDRPFFAPSQ